MSCVKTCNRDCFNCPYEDCVVDDVSTAECSAAENYDRKHGTRYWLNRERYIANAKRWQAENKARVKENAAKYYQANRARKLAYQHEYWLKNKDMIMERRRAKKDVSVPRQNQTAH